MENSNDIMELLDLLYGMINEAWGVPIGNDKCVIEREKAIDIINDIKANLPASIAESKRLVMARDEFIGNAKREAEALRRNAEEQSERMISQQEVLRIASQRSADMIKAAEDKSSELMRAAAEYIDRLMKTAEEGLNTALKTVHSTQSAFRAGNPLNNSRLSAAKKEQEETAAENISDLE